MVLLNRRCHGASDADAVAPHLHGSRLARLIEEGRPHRLTVFRSKGEDLSCLDAAPDVEMPALTDGTRISLFDETDVRHGHRAEVTLRIDIRIVEIRFVRTGNSVVHPHRRLIDDDMRTLFDTDGTHKAGAAARRTDRLLVRHAQLTCARHGICELDLVDLVVTAQERENEDIVLRLIGDCFDRLFNGDLEVFCKQRNRTRMRGRHLRERQLRLVRCIDRTQCRLFIARRIAARIAAGNARLALRREDGKLLGVSAADRTAVRLHRAEVQPAAREDIRVRHRHLAVGLVHPLDILIERIKVFHDKLAAAHDTEARTALIAELVLNLIEQDGQLLVGAQLIAHECRNHLLMRRSHAELAVMAILDTDHLRAVSAPAPTLLPEFGRLEDRHHDLLSACRIHLLTDDLLDLADRTPRKRQIGIHTTRRLAYEPRTIHELMAGDLRLCRCVS